MISKLYSEILSLNGVVAHSDIISAPSDIDIYVPKEELVNVKYLLKKYDFVISYKCDNKLVAMKFECGELYILDLFSRFDELERLGKRFLITHTGHKLLGRKPLLSKDIKCFLKGKKIKDERLIIDFFSNKNYCSLVNYELPIPFDFNDLKRQCKRTSFDIQMSERIRFVKNNLFKGKSFAFLGPDGSGKSYLIDKIRLTTANKIIYMGDWFFVFQPFYNFLFKIPSPFNRFLYILFFIENLIRRFKVGFYSTLGFNVLIDRFPGTNRSSIHAVGILHAVNKLIYKFTPKPDLFVVLHAEPEIVYKRKQELSIHEIDLCQKSIIEMVKYDSHIVVDTTELDFVLNKIVNIIYRGNYEK
ncbi:hypothetical protein MACH09_01640 [Vibrio sp. MACH09]|uniref:hypothetical protein n=1 Tax=Vibrio sp. MACH09 TaxID=3025122 RepID=UPI002791C3D6|nr:hypothetical protein [Vibrio sp. MACH09]GLO59656.1 hypothetical protein MACH09_01640 [Vibrio sp. MACH09]